MRPRTKDKSSTVERIRTRLAADKKKVVTATALVAIMAFMWGKLLLKKGPEEAVASSGVTETTEAVGSDDVSHVSYVDLPYVTGRNDVISRDFFSSAGWRGFGKGAEVGDSTGSNDREVVAGRSIDEIIAGITGSLELQATWVDEQPRAFINDKLVVPGYTLKVDSGGGTYECEVVEIEENRVTLKYGEATVVLKLEGVLK